jgi:hypothetical protein
MLGIMALQRNAGEQETVLACVNDPACSIEAAALRLRRAESDAGSAHLDALRRDERDHPAPRSLPANAAAAQNTVDAVSDRIANAGKPADQRASR